MGVCARCQNPLGFGFVCPACRNVELLQKQNDLLERNSSSSGNYNPIGESEAKIAAGLIILVALLPFIFWDSAPMIFIRGIIGIIVR